MFNLSSKFVSFFFLSIFCFLKLLLVLFSNLINVLFLNYPFSNFKHINHYYSLYLIIPIICNLWGVYFDLLFLLNQAHFPWNFICGNFEHYVWNVIFRRWFVFLMPDNYILRLSIWYHFKFSRRIILGTTASMNFDLLWQQRGFLDRIFRE